MRKSSSTLAGSGKRSAGILSSPARESVTRRISRLLAGDTLAARDGLEGLYLFDQMADVDDALYAGVGALVLVVALELGAGIGDSIAGEYTSVRHGTCLLWPRLREIRPSAGASYVVNSCIVSYNVLTCNGFSLK
jgi:hypothetical protein